MLDRFRDPETARRLDVETMEMLAIRGGADKILFADPGRDDMSTPPSVLELTRRLIRHNTINPPGNERPAAELVGHLLEDAGFSVGFSAFATGRTSLVARIGGSADKRPLCFTGHLDTVPLGGAPWSCDPFAGDTAEDRLYGRGSSDMKSGVAAIVAAMLHLADHLQSGPGVVVVITAGEETGAEGAHHLADAGNLGEAGAIVVAEPTGNYPLVGHKGALWLEGCTRGVTAHASMPECGENAIYKVARAVTTLESLVFDEAPHAMLGVPTVNVGTIQGGLNVNSVPDRAVVGIDIRTIPGQDRAALQAKLRQVLGEDVELSPVVDVDSLWTDPQAPWVREVFEIMEPLLGESPQPRCASYFTDGAVLAPAYGDPPTVILGPGEPTLAHQTDEYCLVDRLEQAVEANVLIARQWCGA